MMTPKTNPKKERATRNTGNAMRIGEQEKELIQQLRQKLGLTPLEISDPGMIRMALRRYAESQGVKVA